MFSVMNRQVHTKPVSKIPGPGQGYLDVNYEATVALSHDDVAPDTVFEVPVSQLPDQVLPYLYPSRYCQSDRLTQLAMELFGQMPKGYRRIEAIQDWVRVTSFSR